MGQIMQMQTMRPRALHCRRCGGRFLLDNDGDLRCLMCGRPEKQRAWEPLDPRERQNNIPAA